MIVRQWHRGLPSRLLILCLAIVALAPSDAAARGGGGGHVVVVPVYIPSGPAQSPERHRCSQLVHDKNWPDLRTFATTWTANKPGDATAWACLGLAEYELRDRKAAIVAFRKSVDINPSKAGAEPVWTALGAAYLSDRQMEASIEASKHALSMKSDDGAALRNLATAYHHLDRITERDEAYAQLKRADPARAEAFATQHLSGRAPTVAAMPAATPPPPAAAPAAAVPNRAGGQTVGGDETVTPQFNFVLKLGRPGDPIAVVAFRTAARNGTIVVCRAFFISGASPAVAGTYKARVDAPTSVLEFKPAGEPVLDVPTAGAPVHFMPAPADKPNGELKFDAIRNAGLPSRCIDTRQPWSVAFAKLTPNPMIVDAP